MNNNMKKKTATATIILQKAMQRNGKINERENMAVYDKNLYFTNSHKLLCTRLWNEEKNMRWLYSRSFAFKLDLDFYIFIQTY